MAQCFEPYCSVDPVSGALSVTTKGGTCTVVPGDEVSVTETPQGWIITVNGVPTLIPRIDPGDDVSFVETPDNYVITINGVPHLIPKCRYYRDCDGNILDQCERIVTCDDLAQRGFISCVDADDFNMVARNVNGVATMCLEIAWDRICFEAETIAVPAEHVLMCGAGGVKKITIRDMLTDLCFPIEDLGTQCGTAQQLVAVADPETPSCFRLARYNAATAQIAQFGSDSVHGPSHNLARPAAPETPASYYSYTELSADEVANSIDEPKLLTTLIADTVIEIECDGMYEFSLRSLTAFDPAANGGAGRASRVVIRVNDEFRLSSANLIADSFSPFTNFVASVEQQFTRFFTAGTYRIREYIVRDGAASQAAQIRLTSVPVTGGVSRSNTTIISKAVM